MQIKRKKRVCTALLKARGENSLQNIFQLFLSWGNKFLSYLIFPDLVLLRQQPIFIGLSGNDHYIFTEAAKRIHSLFGCLGCFVKCFYFAWLEEIWSCQECLGEGGAVAVSSRWAVSIAKVAVRIGIGWGVVRQVNVMPSSECRAIWGAKI